MKTISVTISNKFNFLYFGNKEVVIIQSSLFKRTNYKIEAQRRSVEIIF